LHHLLTVRFPQTKGLSLEQIDVMYQNTTPVKSLAYRRQLIAGDVHPSQHDAGANASPGEDDSELGKVSKEGNVPAEKSDERV
jgi:hypothetical protein